MIHLIGATGCSLVCSMGNAHDLWSLAMNLHKQSGVYFEFQLFHTISNWIHFKFYQGSSWGPSDPETNDITVGNPASPWCKKC